MPFSSFATILLNDEGPHDWISIPWLNDFGRLTGFTDVFHAFWIIWITQVFFEDIVGICWITRFLFPDCFWNHCKIFENFKKGESIWKSHWYANSFLNLMKRNICWKINFLQNCCENHLLDCLGCPEKVSLLYALFCVIDFADVRVIFSSWIGVRHFRSF